MVINGEEHITIKEAAEIIGVSAGRVRQLVASKRLPSIKVGARLNMISRKTAEEFAALHRPVGIHISSHLGT
jgi:excisionase family DNA binding protein